jgi:hypothetical protein
VKQQSVSKLFIAINDKLKVDARVFISKHWSGGESKIGER